MLEHARMTLGLVYELGYHDFSEKSEEQWTDL
jgi:leucyl aminopeptidase